MKKQQLLYRIPIFFLLFFLFFSCENENLSGKIDPDLPSQIDSLYQLAKDAEIDSVKLKYALSVLDLAKQSGSPKRIADARNFIGKLQIGQGDFLKAKKNLDSSLRIRKQLNSQIDLAETYINLGNLFIQETIPDSAHQCFLEGYLILKTIESDPISTIEKSELFRLLGDVNLGLAKSSNDLSSPFSEIEEYLKVGRNHFEIIEDSVRIVKSILELGKIYYDWDSLDQAIIEFTTAEKFSKKIGFTSGIASAQNGIGAVYYALEENDSAKVYFENARAQFEKLNARQNVFDGDLNLCLIDIEFGQLQKAERSAIENIRPVFSEEKRFEDKKWAAEILGTIYSQQLEKNPDLLLTDSILKYKDLEMEFLLETLDETKIKEITRLESTYENKFKDLEISVQIAENRLTTFQRNGLFGAFLLGIGFFILFFLKKKTENALATKKLEHQQLELKKKDLELEQRQMEIKEIVQKAEVDANNSVLSALEIERKKIARTIHDKLGTTLVTVNRGLRGYFKNSEKVIIEKSMLESYTANLDEVYNDLRDISHLLDEQGDFSLTEKLEKFCLLFAGSGKMKIQFLKEGDFSKLETNMKNKLFLFTKELITNVLKHGPDASKIEIQLMRFDKLISLSIIDNGKGFELEKTPLGFGLSKMKTDVEALGGSFLIDSKPGFGTTVMIDIPK